MERTSSRRSDVAALAPWSSRRARSRMAASSTAGTSTGVRSPARLSRARGVASRRSVVTRSPACFGTREGATTPPLRGVRRRERARQDPPGPASSTQTSGVAVEVRVRMRWSLSPWRVPIRPQQTTAASRASPADATALDAVGTASPTDRVRE